MNATNGVISKYHTIGTITHARGADSHFPQGLLAARGQKTLETA